MGKRGIQVHISIQDIQGIHRYTGYTRVHRVYISIQGIHRYISIQRIQGIHRYTGLIQGIHKYTGYML